MKKRFWSFLMALCMVVALLPAAAGAVWEAAPRRLDVSIEAPVEGQKPAATGTSNYAAGTQSTVTCVVWSGELDANGCFKAGVAYTVTVTERINADLAGIFCLPSLCLTTRCPMGFWTTRPTASAPLQREGVLRRRV